MLQNVKNYLIFINIFKENYSLCRYTACNLLTKGNSIMGMSAGQARLLSVTARLTDNELRSQMLTNSKLRLADKSTEASSKYMDALNSQQLMYTSYDGSGNKISQALTANTILSFADLKNQYAMVNTSGQVLVSGTDIKNFESSETMSDFITKYGVGYVDNQEYIDKMTEIFGEDYETLLEGYNGEESIVDYINNTYLNDIEKLLHNEDGTGLIDENTLSAILADKTGTMPKEEYDEWLSNYQNSISGILGAESYDGLLGEYINKLQNPPSLGDAPSQSRPSESEELSKLLDSAGNMQQIFETAFNSVSYYDETGTSIHDYDAFKKDTTNPTADARYIEHMLCSLIWSSDGLAEEPEMNPGKGKMISNGEKSISVTNDYLAKNDCSLTGAVISNIPQFPEILKFLKDNSNYTVVQNIIDQIKDLYVKACFSLHSDTILDSSTSNSLIIDMATASSEGITFSASASPLSKLEEGFNELIDSISKLKDNLKAEMDAEYDASHDAWDQELIDFEKAITDWAEDCDTMLKEFRIKLEDLSNIEPKLLDTSDSRYQWYKNLWYRMGGISETEKDESGKNYKELDPNLLNNSEWLEFALEHGIITLEQAQYSEKGSAVYKNMGTYDWTSIIYSNASDIVSVEDEAAIARAEVEYENAVREIENEDKKIDQDLKKLDTEHSALQTEYDSIKSVIDKNVERSFKAFS